MRGILLLVAALAVYGGQTDALAQAKVPRVGVFSQKAAGAQPFFQAFERSLAERGWTNGKNVELHFRYFDPLPAELSRVAEEFVRLKVDVIHASAAPPLRAAYTATRTIPIVGLDFTNDPVAAGFADSYNRPGRNVTGVFLDAPELAGKWLQILRELKPGLSRVGVLWERGPGPAHLRALESATRAIKVDLQIVEISKADEFEQAVNAVARTDAVIVLPSPFFYGHSARLAGLLRERGLLAIAIWRSFAEAGGAVSVGPDLMESAERMAHMTAKILGGAKPGDLPIERPTKFEFIVNQKTIKALGLSVPETLLLRADEVIR